MTWWASQPLSASTGAVVVSIAIVVLTYSWVRGVLFLGSIAFIAVPLARDGDYAGRVLTLVTVSALACLAYALASLWLDLEWGTLAGFFSVVSTLVAGWIWIQRGAHSKLTVALVFAGIILISLVARSIGSTHTFPEHEPDDAPIKVLLDRDSVFLEGLYKAASGRRDVSVAVGMLASYVELNASQAIFAAERLLGRGQINWDEDGISLTRSGVETVERSHRSDRRKHPVSNTFNFHANSSGVFGSGNVVSGNEFTAAGVPADLLQAALAQAHELRSRVAPIQAQDIAEAERDIREAGPDQGRLRRGARRLAYVATAVGEAGGPLLRAANEIIAALPG